MVADVGPLCDVNFMGEILRRIAGVALLSVCFCAVTACAEGWKASEAESRNWLPGAYPHLRRVIVLLRMCQPTRSSGYQTIWVDGSNDDVKPRCSLGDDGQIAEIRNELRAAHLLGVNYLPSGDSRVPVSWAEFILFREGIVTSGSMTSVKYEAKPQPCEATSDGDESFRVLYRPITSAPCRWFWVRSEG